MKLQSLLMFAFCFLVSNNGSAQEEPPPRTGPRGWEVETLVTGQGVFDSGIHMFSGSSWIRGVEVRGRRDAPEPGGESDGLRFSPEIAYGLSITGRTLGTAYSSSLDLHRGSAGLRASAPIPVARGLRGFVRGGGVGFWSNATFTDAFGTHEHDAWSGGAYAGGGLQLAAGRLFAPRTRLSFTVEAGHTVAAPLEFRRWGSLKINGASVATGASVRF
jgi:hypothetical protein